MKSKTISTSITLLIVMIAIITAKKYSYSACDSSSSLNTANLACSKCPADTIPNNYQTIATSCQCAAGFLSDFNGTCQNAITSQCASSSTFEYYPLYKINGDLTTGSITCTPCAENAFMNMYNHSHKEMQQLALPAGKTWSIFQDLLAANAIHLYLHL